MATADKRADKGPIKGEFIKKDSAFRTQITGKWAGFLKLLIRVITY